MFSVLAVSAPTSTRELEPKRIPPGLIRKIWPLAESCPLMTLGDQPATRFSAMDAALGCWKRTASFAAMLKCVQSITRRSVAWLICMDVAVGVLTVADPAATVPP